MSQNINQNNQNEINYLRAEFVFSDETANFVNPPEPNIGDTVTIIIRTAKDDAEKVFFHFDKLPAVEMEKFKDAGRFSYYRTYIISIMATASYYFSLYKNKEIYYYNKKGLSLHLEREYDFKIIPGFNVPDWAKGCLSYQIYVDRFCNGDSSNDVLDNEYIYLDKPVVKSLDWHAPVPEDDTCNFYGGDIQGIINKLDYIKGLGVEAILLNPVFVSPSNHKYDIQDYDYVDPHFGVVVNDGGRVLSPKENTNRFAAKYLKRTTDTINLEKSNELLAKFIELAHEKGMKVILDGVFNHCGSFNKWLDKEGFYERAGGYKPGAFANRNSPYHNYFKWNSMEWPDNEDYDSWWGHSNHPKLNFEQSSTLYNKMMEIGRKWVSPPYNADGWRLDVAADLGNSPDFNHKFWKDFRVAVKSANPNAIILAEHYGDIAPWLLGDEWDTVMNYDAFMEPVTWFFTGMQKHSDKYDGNLLNNAYAFEESMRKNMAKFSIGSQLTALNQLSNHDHSRFLTRTNKTVGRLPSHGHEGAWRGINKSVMYCAVVVQMTWQGAPGIYYGDEAGLCGWTDPDNRRTYPWGREDQLLINFHSEIAKLRQKYKALKNGSLEYLYNHHGILSYGRWNNEHRLAVVINNKPDKEIVTLPVWKLEAIDNSEFIRIMHTRNGSYNTSLQNYKVINGNIEIKLDEFSAVILVQNCE
ncbi:MAG: glycoside hydrolase family 13 protein [Defluviitaleaceae bacterium]|nr:glycoside hydrolase family 13 protein [Defluviitaleaceae bacterium]